MWAGYRPGLPRVHDSSLKKKFTSTIDIFNMRYGQWSTHLTRGIPPLGVISYRCTVTSGSSICYFGGLCGHDLCCHNSINRFDTLAHEWTQLQPTDDSVMKRGFGGIISVGEGTTEQLLTIGGLGSPPTNALPQYQYTQLS